MESGGTGTQNPSGRREVAWPPPPPTNETVYGGQVGRGYQLSNEELKAFKECRTEAFWYRGVPFSAILITGSKVLAQRGIGKFGPFRSMAYIGVGLLGGLASYQGECRKKILAIPGSEIAEALRTGKGLGPAGPPGPGHGYGSGGIPPSTMDAPVDPNAAREVMARDGGSSHLNMDTSYQQSKGLDDSYRPTMANEGWQSQAGAPQSQQPQQQRMSYDDLRRANRADYERRAANVAAPSPVQAPQDPAYQPPAYQPPSYQPPMEIPKTKHRTNQWGDVIEE